MLKQIFNRVIISHVEGDLINMLNFFNFHKEGEYKGINLYKSLLWEIINQKKKFSIMDI